MAHKLINDTVVFPAVQLQEQKYISLFNSANTLSSVVVNVSLSASNYSGFSLTNSNSLDISVKNSLLIVNSTDSVDKTAIISLMSKDLTINSTSIHFEAVSDEASGLVGFITGDIVL